MTLLQKKEIISKVVSVLNELLDIEYDTIEKNTSQSDVSQPVELLSVKECAETFSGLSERAVRQLVTQNKIPCIKTGTGKKSKILINKSALLNYLNNIS